jgi:hypothetical protein
VLLCERWCYKCQINSKCLNEIYNIMFWKTLNFFIKYKEILKSFVKDIWHFKVWECPKSQWLEAWKSTPTWVLTLVIQFFTSITISFKLKFVVKYLICHDSNLGSWLRLGLLNKGLKSDNDAKRSHDINTPKLSGKFVKMQGIKNP